MDDAKVHIAWTVLVVQAFALIDPESTLPYFPIEISRTAASSQGALWAMRFGFSSSIMRLLLAGTVVPGGLYVWFGLLLVAWIPDTMSLVLHNAGTVLIFIGAIKHIAATPSARRRRWLLLLAAIGINGLRNMLVLGSLWLTDSHGTMETLLQRHRQIMFSSPQEPVCISDRQLIPVYQLAGILQWLAFITLSCVF